MNHSQLSLFVKIAESGSFTKAGQELNMTQPAVSRAISTLESELDITLLIRDRKNGVLLTDIGQRLLVLFRDILNGYERVEQEITAEKGFEVGTIRIGAFPAVSARFLPRILRVIGDKYPGLKFVLHEGTIDEIRGWLASRFIDVGWIIPPSEELETVPFAKDNLILLLRDDHPLQGQAEIAIQDLDDEPLILCRGGFDVPIIELFDSFGVALNMRYAVHNVNTAISMVQEGLGMAIVSDTSMIQSVLPPGVRLRKFEPQPFRDIYLAVPSMKDASLAVKLFIQTALDLNRTEGSTDEGR